MEFNMDKDNEQIELVIDGVLDLHTFRPSDVPSLIPEYISECIARDIHHLRIIHGKGSGKLRATVHALLRRDKRVKSFFTAPEEAGGWGATLVTVR